MRLPPAAPAHAREHLLLHAHGDLSRHLADLQGGPRGVARRELALLELPIGAQHEAGAGHLGLAQRDGGAGVLLERGQHLPLRTPGAGVT